jgi:hypothetical protein
MEMIQEEIQKLKPKIPVNVVVLPDGDSINETWLKYGAQAVAELIKSDIPREKPQDGLKIINEYKISFEGNAGTYLVIGRLSMEMQNMKVSLQIVDRNTERKHRIIGKTKLGLQYTRSGLDTVNRPFGSPP